MTITIRLPPETEKELVERASRLGQDVSEYVQQLIAWDIREPRAVALALAPFREQVERSGMTDDELVTFFEGIREEVWQEKHSFPSISEGGRRKAQDWALIAASIIASLWALFIFRMMPLGICDTIFNSIRSELLVPHDFGEASHFAGRICGDVGSMLRQSVAIATLPSVLINLAACLVLGVRMQRGGPRADRSTP